MMYILLVDRFVCCTHTLVVVQRNPSSACVQRRSFTGERLWDCYITPSCIRLWVVRERDDMLDAEAVQSVWKRGKREMSAIIELENV